MRKLSLSTQVLAVNLLTWVALALQASASGLSRTSPAGHSCTSAREYVTALEFLRGAKDLAVPEADARKVAERVVDGCIGSARRFIRVTQLLVRAGLGSKDAIETAIEFAGRTEREAETFTVVFQYAFSADHLDLDLRASMRMARALSTEFEGDILAVRDDFEKVVKFCVNAQGLDLPKPQCGELAARVARQGQKFSGGVGGPFVEAFEFLTSPSGPAISTGEALPLAEELIASGPGAAENFIQGYRYAASKTGLELSVRDAMAFARRMAERTAGGTPPPAERTAESRRKPAPRHSKAER